MLGVFVPGVIQKNNNMLIRYFMNFLPEVVGDDFKVIDFYKSCKMKNELGESVSTFDMPIDDILKDANDWNEVAFAIDEYLDEGHFTSFVCYKSLMDTGFLKFGFENGASRYLKRAYEENSAKYMNYTSMRKKICWLVFIDRCSKRAEHFYQYVTDPQEADFNKVFEFKDFKRLYYNKATRTRSLLMPFYEYMLDKDSDVKLPKTSPFTFYCSAVTDDRAYIAEMQEGLESIEGWDVNIGTRDTEHKTLMVSQDEYFYMLKAAKVSLVIRPYDHEAFSWTRFCECLYNDCVPLVWNDCNFQDVETIFPEVVKFTKENLLVGSIDELKQMVDWLDNDLEARLNTLDFLKTCVYKKNVLDIQWLRDRWQKLPGIRGE